MAHDYLDFDITIDPLQDDAYPVWVSSPAGEATGIFRMPYEGLALELQLTKLQNALLRGALPQRLALPPEHQAVQDFGQALFNALFAGEVRNRYDVSRERARGSGLRVRLRIGPSELATLPWEYLHDSRSGSYICTSTRTPLVRYLPLAQPVEPLTVTPPLKILAIVASPAGLPKLDVARERERLTRALAGLESRGLAKLTWIEGATVRDLQRTLRRGPWHIFHFVGHGGFDGEADEGFLAMEDSHGEIARLYATQLGQLLGDHGPLRLATLNACEGARGSARDTFSSTASILVRSGLPAVLAMQYAVTDEAAITLAEGFYEALADDLPVDAAVAEARKALTTQARRSLEWGTPVLTMHARDGRLFVVEPETTLAAHERALVLDEIPRESPVEQSASSDTPSVPASALSTPTTAVDYVERAAKRYDERDYAGALSDCEEALRLDPTSARAYNGRGLVRKAQGDITGAISDLNEAIRLDQKLIRAYYNRGNIYLGQGKHELAISDYTEVIRLDPKFICAYQNRASAKRAKNDYDGAMSDYNEAIRHDPAYYSSYYGRGLVYHHRGDFSQALTEFTEALRINPLFGEAYIDRGVTRDDMHDYDGAISDFNAAIRLDPKSTRAYANRGNARRAKGDINGAIADYNEALSIDPRNAPTYFNRGQVRAQRKERDLAIADYRKARELATDTKLRDLASARLRDLKVTR